MKNNVLLIGLLFGDESAAARIPGIIVSRLLASSFFLCPRILRLRKAYIAEALDLIQKPLTRGGLFPQLY